MKLKTIIVTLLIAFASINAASAYAIGDVEDVTLNLEESHIYYVTVTGAASPSNFSAAIVDATLTDASAYFSLEIEDVPMAFGTNVPWTGEDKTFKVKVTNNNAPDGDYQLQFTNLAEGGTIVKPAQVTSNVTAIPEFPTVALPVAAILGLAFLFQRRKEE